MLKIRKELDESNGDSEGKVARKPHPGLSLEEQTPEFVGEIQAMVDNNPRKSTSSIAREMGVHKYISHIR